ncbi:MAG: hypothetical protein M3O55_01765 [Actinomycetota bacterium]|nr:hypothetical protein [Actinomycetota bacterium]
MNRTRTAVRLIALGALSTAALLAPAGTTVAGAATSAVAPVFHPAAVSPAQIEGVRKFWTPQRLRAAKPVDLPTGRPAPSAKRAAPSGPAVRIAPFATSHTSGSDALTTASGANGQWTGSQTSLPAKDIGVLNFTHPDGSAHYCSASVVVSGNRDLLLTAGHCVYDKSFVARYGTGWFGNYVFYPGYNGTATNQAPYGAWVGRGAGTTGQWLSSGDLSYDIGMVVLNTNSAGRHISDVLGNAFGLEWNLSRGHVIANFGYPQDPVPYDGRHLDWCKGTEASGGGGSPTRNRVLCDMGHGSSGGPWLDQFSSTSGWGYANSVNSTTDGTYEYSPYFNDTFGSLYNAMKNI